MAPPSAPRTAVADRHRRCARESPGACSDRTRASSARTEALSFMSPTSGPPFDHPSGRAGAEDATTTDSHETSSLRRVAVGPAVDGGSVQAWRGELPGLDEHPGEVGELAVGPLARLAQLHEGLLGRHAVALDEDAERHADDPAVVEGPGEVLRAIQGERCVHGNCCKVREVLRATDRLDVEGIRGEAVEGEHTEGCPAQL